MKRVYYYLRKYPEYGIKDFEIKDVLYLKNMTNDIFSIQYLISDYDIEMECKDEDKWISVYQPYEDEDILVHDKSHTLYGFDYILSFDKEKITKQYKEHFNGEKERLTKRMMKFEKEQNK